MTLIRYKEVKREAYVPYRIIRYKGVPKVTMYFTLASWLCTYTVKDGMLAATLYLCVNHNV